MTDLIRFIVCILGDGFTTKANMTILGETRADKCISGQ